MMSKDLSVLDRQTYRFALEDLLTGPLFLCKMTKYHIKIMKPQREKLKLIVRNLELLVDALKAEVYSDVDAYSIELNSDEISDYDEIFEDDDG